jgi:hypothetical protein
MRNTLIYSFLCLQLFANAQWSSTVTLNSFNNNGFSIDHFCVANENSVFAGGKKQETSNSSVSGIMYYTLDGGAVWDSIEFANRFIDAIESPSPNVIYYVSTQLVYPTGGGPYAKKYLHRSMDSGQTWNESLIDSSSFGLMYNALSFFNDSTGILRLGTSNDFITRDYGQNWTPFDLPIYKFSTTLGGDTLLMAAQNIYTVNLNTMDIVDSLYSANCTGSLQSSDKIGDTLIRAYVASNDINNYTSLTIDEYPLGNQRILHFPQLSIIVSVRITLSSLYLLSGSIARSSDGGYTFYEQYSIEPDADTSVFMYFDFANENIGYAVTRSFADNTFKVQKTTNGGGITTNYIDPPIQFTAGINEPLKNKVSIYPNPSSTTIQISASTTLDEIYLFDLQGKLIMQVAPQQSKVTMDVSDISSGTYIVQAKNSNGILISKFMKP